jgi:hypothetical protein
MKPIEILIQHWERIQQVFSEIGSWPKTYEIMKSEFPEIAGMSLATFKQYSPILIELNKQLNNSTELNTVKQELEAVKQELNRSQELNTGLNKELELNKLNNQGLNMQVKQEAVKQEAVKHGLNIAGWNVQESGGYFRAFKKMGGKMKAVYLGKNLDDAETKIRNKEKQMAGGDPG